MKTDAARVHPCSDISARSVNIIRISKDSARLNTKCIFRVCIERFQLQRRQRINPRIVYELYDVVCFSGRCDVYAAARYVEILGIKLLRKYLACFDLVGRHASRVDLAAVDIRRVCRRAPFTGICCR